jgi:choline dehydrogenase-like flavoprotein
MQISYNNFLTDLDVPAAHALVAAAGIAPNANPDDGTDLSMPAQGVARTVDPHSGLRSYSASAYFDADARTRDNLHLVTNAVVSRIIFNGRRAQAVEFQSDGKLYTVAVKKEVVLATGMIPLLACLRICDTEEPIGSIKTPQILELSGVGNRTLLEKLGIPVVLDLPEVGENLQDHPVTLSDFRLKPGIITLGMVLFQHLNRRSDSHYKILSPTKLLLPTIRSTCMLTLAPSFPCA